MLLILKYNKRTGCHQLERAGYTQRRWGDWIRKDSNGRWHIHKLQKGVFSIHFDLYIGDIHYAPKMPEATKAEIKQILQRSVTTRNKINQMEVQKLFQKYKGH